MTNRALVFVIGILLGLLGGAVVVYSVTGSSVKNIFVVKENSPAAKKRETVEGSVNKTQAKPKIQKQAPPLPKKIPSATAEIEKKPVRVKEIPESEIIFNVEEDIVIKTDELLKSYTVPVVIQQSLPNPSDSLAEAVSGIKPSKPTASLLVEYWKSPINYRGYKMNKNKLVLYGLPEADDVKIVNTNEKVYMKHREKYYQLQPSLDFRPFEYVIDPRVKELVDEL